MPFFDRMSRTFSETGQKTRNYADISRLNSKISENDMRIHEIRSEIGELYCEVHGADAEPAFADRVAQVLEMQAQNAAWREEIQTLRGLVKCPSCGNYVADNAPFCSACGRRLLADTAVICPRCGMVLEQGMVFCRNCGLRLPTEPSGENAAAFVCDCGEVLTEDTLFCPKCGAGVADMRVRRAAAEGETDASAGLHCANCGASLAEGDIFCRMCGVPVVPLQPDLSQSTPAPESEAPAPEGPEPLRCAVCGAPLAFDDLFCNNCGTPVHPEGQSAPESAPAAPPRTKRCPHCGREQEAEALFCAECGTRLS